MNLSIIARAIEVYYCVLEAIRILKGYDLPEQTAMPVTFAKGEGYSCTEAPRGMLWHHYKIDEFGKIASARIVPPTSQNQARIEEDLYNSLILFGLDKTPEELRSYSERIIRNYDPCISCATHFLKLKVHHL